MLALSTLSSGLAIVIHSLNFLHPLNIFKPSADFVLAKQLIMNPDLRGGEQDDCSWLKQLVQLFV